MRKKAVGLLGNAKGAAKPFRLLRIPVYRRNIWRIILLISRAARQPRLKLRYVRSRRRGVLHVRPALDMCDPQQEILISKSLMTWWR